MSARRGAILFEVLLSVAIFTVAAAFTLRATRSVVGSIDDGRREALVLDLARSTLSELAAGLATVADLRDETRSAVGSIEWDDPTGPADPDATVFVYEVDSERTEFPGLALVTLTVREQLPDGSFGVAATLRQLLPLRRIEPEAYREDEMLEGLPTERDSP